MAELKYVKELISTDTGTEGQLLIPRKIYDVLIEEVDKHLLPRSLAARYFGPSDIPGSSIDINVVNENELDVREVAEGAEFPIDATGYSSINIKPSKYGVAVRITREMLEDAKWNLLEHNIRIAGKRMAENETNLILTALQGCSNSVSGGAAITIANINSATLQLNNNDYTETDILVGPEVLSDLRNIDTFVEFSKVGNTEMLQKGFIGTIYGMNVVRFSANAAPSTTYSKYAYVIDRNHAYVIAEKRPVTVERFEMPAYDMSAAVISQRIAVKLLRDNAVCRISTS